MIAILIGVVVFLILVFWINNYQNKYQSWQGNIFNFVILVLFLFFFFSFYNLNKNYEFDLSTLSGLTSAIKIYFAWMGSFFKSAASITGQVFNYDWFGNVTNINN